ncbi:MAG: FAD-dependent oxidoreductase [Candidatus Nanoarchaeia archaeon]|nr:FAD-dependent oxidoreductase [Candidatus Nanoarchaeia archaeon]
MYDVAIIGAGPAGLTAGIYCARKMLKTVILYKEIGGQAATAKRVENWPGIETISGAELIDKIYKQAKKLGCEFKQASVSKIMCGEKCLEIATEKEIIVAKAVIIATGRTHKQLSIEGEKEFIGRGVAYCATCDAPFFKNKVVAVTGSDNMAFDSAFTLAKIATKIYMIYNKNDLTADKKIVNDVRAMKNVEFIEDYRVNKIKGDKVVKQIELKDLKNKTKIIDVDGIFIEVGFVAPESMMPEIKTDNEGQIIVDSEMATSVKGIFSAGDITSSPFKQMITASGDSAKAAISAEKYLKSVK